MAVNTSDQIKAFWTEFADFYEATALAVTTSVFNSFVYLLRLRDAERILEVGCGPGNGIPAILAEAGPATEIVATDLSPAMVEKARERQLPRTTVQEANNESLPFPDSHFDRYIANLSLMLVSDPEQMLREAYRVTKPGARCAFSVWGSEASCTFMTIVPRVCAELGIEMPVKKRSPFHLNDRERLRQMILTAGFSEVYCFENGYPIPQMSESEIMQYYGSTPELAGLRESGQYETVREALQTSVRETLQSGNLIIFCGLVAIAIK